MTIDDQPVPALVLEAWKQSIVRATPAAIQALVAQQPELGAGFRIGKIDLTIARNRIQRRLGQLQELPCVYRDLLVQTTLSASLVSVLSQQVLERWAVPLCHCFGTVALVAALYLDERDAVRHLAPQWLAHPPAPEEAPTADTVRVAAPRLQAELLPLLAHLHTLSAQAGVSDAASSVVPTAPNAHTPAPTPSTRRTANEQRLMQAWREKDKESKRLRRELNALTGQHQQQGQALASAQHALESAKTLAATAEAERIALQTQWETRVTQRVTALWDERLLPWLRPAETLADEVAALSSNHSSLLQQADALLQRQAAHDRLHGLRSQLRTELLACQQAHARLVQAHRDALRPLPELLPLAQQLQARMQHIEQCLHNHAPLPAPAHPLLAQMEQTLATQQTLDGVAAMRRALQASATLGWLDNQSLQQAYALIDQASIRLYALTSTAPRGAKNLALPLRALQTELAQGHPATLLVDGHNVLFTQTAAFKPWYEQGQPGAQAREHLTALLVATAQRYPTLHIHLWFDGPVLSDSTRAANMRVHFSGGQGSDRADARLLAYLHHLQVATPAHLRLLVTQDQAQAAQAEDTGAWILAPAELLYWVRPHI
ncbi:MULTISPECIES: hypothetical protein [Giesbergeria]|uniref:Uncharacterized protein n=1 Tax=Giesbergeria sinuosa TaxID=80883 RepID=A0ABV9QB08_9BURK